jgi:catechol 2,3-dioxygenase-like lactoylglutathione lyase family enzyme
MLENRAIRPSGPASGRARRRAGRRSAIRLARPNGWLNPRMGIELRAAIPILRMHNVAVTKRFYLDYLGCNLDAQEGEEDSPTFMKVSRGAVRLHLSSHHDDGTPGAVVLVVTSGVAELHAELAAKNYPYLNPGLEPGPGGRGLELQVIDPVSNRLRFYEPPDSPNI